LSESPSIDVQSKDSDFHMRIKICGITSVEDGLCAARLGADAIGLVFYSKSPRYVKTSQARDIAYAVGPFTTLVGLFVDESEATIASILEQVPLQLLQFHGNESAAYCQQFARPYVKAIRMQEGLDVKAAINQHPKATGILLDAYRPGVPGGTGEVFDWQRFPKNCEKPMILAGGLRPENIAQAIAETQPYAVDVSGGVEKGPGIKDSEKITAFIKNARAQMHQH
jgi:phosphoribosylanthranilate isomerase